MLDEIEKIIRHQISEYLVRNIPIPPTDTRCRMDVMIEKIMVEIQKNYPQTNSNVPNGHIPLNLQQ